MVMAIKDVIKLGRLRWFGHVKRREEGNWIRKCMRSSDLWGVPLNDDDEVIDTLVILLLTRYGTVLAGFCTA